MEGLKPGGIPKGLEPGVAVGLPGLIQNAEGSIVSRVLVKSPNGSLTLFSFDQGQALSEHQAPYHALVQVLEGSAGLTVGGKALEVKAGESALMPAGVPHSVTAPVPMKMLLTMIKA